MAPMQAPTAKQRKLLAEVTRTCEEVEALEQRLAFATNRFWDAMRKARKAGASYGQVAQATTMPDGRPKLTRARVQQIVKPPK